MRGFRCFVAEFGDADRTVVLVHGWGSDSTDWSDQIADMSRSARVVTFDLRGHGHSERTDSGYATDDLAEDAIALLDTLGLRGAHLVGHSLGGIVANLVAVRRPELVRSLLLIDPAHGQPPRRRTEVLEQMGDPRSADSSERAAVAADIPPGIENAVTAARRIRRRLQALAAGPQVIWPTLVGMYDGAEAPGLSEASERALRRRTQPAYSIYAHEPTYRWEQALDLPGSRCELWSGLTHFLHQDDPERFNRVASAWFTEVELATASPRRERTSTEW